MLVGVVEEVGPESTLGLAAGDHIATLVSLTLTPLVIEDELARWDGLSEQVPCDGYAILFGRSIAAVLPDDLPGDARAGGHGRLRRPGADRSGRQPVRRRRSAPDRGGHRGSGQVRLARPSRRPAAPAQPVRPSASCPSSARPTCSATAGLADAIALADARDPVALSTAVADALGGSRRTSPSSASTSRAASTARSWRPADGGTVIFFSMATSFSDRRARRRGTGRRRDDARRQRLHARPRRLRLRPAARGARRPGPLREPPRGTLTPCMTTVLTSAATTLLLGGAVHSPADDRTATAMLVADDQRRVGRVRRRGAAATATRADHGRRARRRAGHAGVRRRPRARHLDRADAHRARPRRLRRRWPRPSTGSSGSAARPARPAGARARLGRDPVAGAAATDRRPSSTGRRYGSQVYLTRIDVHSALASSALLAVLPGIRDAGRLRPVGPAHRRGPPRGPGGGARRGHARGPHGCAARHPRAARPSSASAPSTSSAGRTSPAPTTSPAMLALAAAEAGPDVVGYWGELGGIERARELGALGAAGDLFADGAIGSHTACMRSVYADEETFGDGVPHGRRGPRPRRRLHPRRAPGRLPLDRRRRHGSGRRRVRGGGRDRRPRGRTGCAAPHRARRDARRRAHRPDGAPRPRTPRVQPVFDALWGGESGMYVERLGLERALTLNPFADMAAAGIPLALGLGHPGHAARSVGGRPGRRPPPRGRSAAVGGGRVRRAHHAAAGARPGSTTRARSSPAHPRPTPSGTRPTCDRRRRPARPDPGRRRTHLPAHRRRADAPCTPAREPSHEPSTHPTQPGSCSPSTRSSSARPAPSRARPAARS